ncbi:phosphate ABC transporter substrate-binding protein PstS [Actinokineospora diospyrosa]|uniref:Phosphate ABC transporter substrate-binding protein, PhoT family (TC 3.A.1.7.1) n=1 Tax=Actinokineospora diospyrosa TaxID=103728 RepID=A0ABT1IAI5_9PSEU|nr:phosphate ABC transporter substrate-binding protein PstS [Actinokineospora diospyrosa]MCP2269556.1 phosphate ABC transporter substrate-binding protein, PhoT family (TC 3.A.1.7.1) [Actinokineospora diospyrosa]
MTPQGRARGVGLLATLVVLATAAVGFAPTASAQGYVPISGSGSTWSFNALDQWRKNVQQFGIRINFSGTGSTDGRNQFKAGQVDFAVSEIPYGLTDAGVRDIPPPDGKFAYMPIVAGGTSLMYNLNIAGKRVTNLRLSGDTVTKIFTRKITMWNDAAIAADNPALTLPARQIVPVVRSDGSGSTAQFTSYLADQHGADWDDFCHKAGRVQTPCGFTSNFPSYQGIVGQVGSIGVANYVRQAQSDGAITYVEYSYAKNAGFPVAKLLNKSGFYIAPTAQAVAVGLLKAEIDPNDLTQKLQGVYNSTDDRTYPMSSYSYMILPTAIKGTFNELKGKTLSDFSYYFLCEGQQQAERLGFSPLPINLVQAGLKQVERIPGSTKKPTDISKCNNPTFSTNGTNTLAQTAPHPQECDKKGSTVQCDASGKAVTKKGAVKTTAAAKPGETAPGAAETPGTDPGAATEGEGAATGDTAAEESTEGGLSAVPVSVDLPQDDGTLLVVVAAVLMVVLVAGPPLVARLMRGKG